MSIKFLFPVLLLALFTSCKDEPKSIPSTDIETQEMPSSDKKETSDTIATFDGTWKSKTSTQESEVILENKNNEVSGTLIYQEFDDQGEMISSTGLLSLIGTTENGLLNVDVYDPKGRKASTATISLEGNTLNFKLTGNKINYPDRFSAQKIDWFFNQKTPFITF